jgi:hypothetical protein
MAISLVPTTTLEAVNQCLFAIGEAPGEQVEDSGLVDAATALRTLCNVSREVQKDGWHWNTEINFRSPDVDGNLPAALWTLKVDTVGADQWPRPGARGQRLYDRVNHTYVFDRPVTVELVVLLDFEEIPEAARNYIALRAARRFQQNSVGSVELAGFQAAGRSPRARGLQNAEAETQDFGMLNDQRRVARVLAR